MQSRRHIDGVLLLDKPRGISSNHALLCARRLLAADKAGHGGTLDPMASGLLPVLFGEATKFAFDLLDADKTYLATLTLGQISTTADGEGEISATGAKLPGEATLQAVLQRFVGDIEQLPPMHSALKHQGRPLYDYARKGVQIERAPRRVRIHSVAITAFSLPRVVLRVTCSKGTYIRTLAQDIGEAAGCGAWLSDLRREAVGPLTLSASISLEGLGDMDAAQRERTIAPIDCLLQSLPRIDVSADLARRFGHGQRLRVAGENAEPARRVAVFAGQTLLGLATLENGVIAPSRLVAVRDQRLAPGVRPAAELAGLTPASLTDLSTDRAFSKCGTTPPTGSLGDTNL